MKRNLLISVVLALGLLPLSFLPTVTVVGAEERQASDFTTFDKMSLTGVTNDPNALTSPVCVRLEYGWATFEFGDFKTMEMDLYLRAYYSGRPLYITIGDSGDSENYVEIRVEALTTQGTRNVDDTYVGVKDCYGGEKRSDDKTRSGVKIFKTWARCTIEIKTPTLFSTQGSGKELTITIGNQTMIEGFSLRSAELSTETTIRTWNEITFESRGYDIWRLDEIYASTDSLALTDVPVTMLVVSFAGVAALFIWRWRKGKKGGPKKKLFG